MSIASVIHPVISSSDTLFSVCPPSFPASGTFPMSWLFALGDQNTGVSDSALVLPMNIQGLFPLRLIGLISLLSKGLLRVFYSTTVGKHQFFSAQPSLWSSSHSCTWLLEKNIALTLWTFVGKAMSLLLNMLSRFVIALLPRSKHTQLVSEAIVTEPGMGVVTWPWLVLWFCTNKNDLDRRAKKVEQSGRAVKMQRSSRRERKERQANGWD